MTISAKESTRVTGSPSIPLMKYPDKNGASQDALVAMMRRGIFLSLETKRRK